MILCSLDRVKSEARKHAWYLRPGEPASHKYNPFVKTRAPSNRHAGQDPEKGLGKAHTEGCLEELNGAKKSAGGLESHPHEFNHANTMPISPSSPIEMPKATEAALPEQGEPERRATNAVSSGQSPTPEAKHRRRDRLARKFKRHGKKSEDGGRDDGVTGNSKKQRQHFTFMSQIKATLFNSWINILLVAVPAGIIINYLHVNPVAIFIVNFIAIVPLAALLSYATEEIALRFGETLGGLLNATFGSVQAGWISCKALTYEAVTRLN